MNKKADLDVSMHREEGTGKTGSKRLEGRYRGFSKPDKQADGAEREIAEGEIADGTGEVGLSRRIYTTVVSSKDSLWIAK